MSTKSEADVNYKNGQQYFQNKDFGKAFGYFTTAVDLYSDYLEGIKDEAERQAIAQNIWSCEEHIEMCILEDGGVPSLQPSFNKAYPYLYITPTTAPTDQLPKSDHDLLSAEVLNTTLDCEVVSESSGFSQVLGNADAISQLYNYVALKFFLKLNPNPSSATPNTNSILLFGHPGCGKSFILRALMSELVLISEFHSLPSVTIWRINAQEIVDKYGEQAASFIGLLFKKAKARVPSLICVEEVDNFKGSSEVEKSFMECVASLNQEDGVICVGTTARPLHMSRLVLKEFSRKIYISLPDVTLRQQIIKDSLCKHEMTIKPERLRMIAERCEHYTVNEVRAIVTEIYKISAAPKSSNSNWIFTIVRNMIRNLKRGSDKLSQTATKSAVESAILLVIPIIKKHDIKRMKEFAEHFSNTSELIVHPTPKDVETVEKVEKDKKTSRMVSALLFFHTCLM